MKRVSLPGGWVDFREPEDVPERLRRRVTTLAPAAAQVAADAQKRSADTDDPQFSSDDLRFLLEFNDAVAICLVMGWAWDAPVTVEGLLDLPASAYDAIVKHGQENVSRLLPNFSVDPDPKAPTAN